MGHPISVAGTGSRASAHSWLIQREQAGMQQSWQPPGGPEQDGAADSAQQRLGSPERGEQRHGQSEDKGPLKDRDSCLPQLPESQRQQKVKLLPDGQHDEGADQSPGLPAQRDRLPNPNPHHLVVQPEASPPARQHPQARSSGVPFESAFPAKHDLRTRRHPPWMTTSGEGIPG